MRVILVTTFLILSAVSAIATSYDVQAGSLYYNPITGQGSWTPRMLQIDVGGGTPHQIPFTFSSANLTVSCSPMCAVGDTFSLDLKMSGFVTYFQNSIFNGTLDLVTKPQTLLAASGQGIAYFVLTGSLSGCYSPVPSCPFTIAVDLHRHLWLNYQIVNGQMQISSMGYEVPEPPTIILVASGICVICFLNRKRSRIPQAHW